MSVVDSLVTKPLPLKRFGMEARVGIEHQTDTFQNLHNSQQHKPLRSFLNVFNVLTRVRRLQELFWKDVLLFSTRPQTIAKLLFYWSFYWRLIYRSPASSRSGRANVRPATMHQTRTEVLRSGCSAQRLARQQHKRHPRPDARWTAT